MSRPAQVVVITGASSGFGAYRPRPGRRRPHRLRRHARDHRPQRAPGPGRRPSYAAEHGWTCAAVELDVHSQESVDAAVARIEADAAASTCVVHNAGHMVLGPAEAFTPEQLADALRHERAVHPAGQPRRPAGHAPARARACCSGSVQHQRKGGTPPYLAPYFAAKAGMDALAVSYAAELARCGIETSIVVPGAFTDAAPTTSPTPAPPPTPSAAAEYEEAYGRLREADARPALAALAPPGRAADVVADEIVRVVALPAGQRPFRVPRRPQPTTAARRSPRSPTASAPSSSPASASTELSRRARASDQHTHQHTPPPARSTAMPFANFKVPDGTLTQEDKKKIVDRTTDLYAEIYGERARQGTLVLVEEVTDGGWGIGGNVLTAAMLNGES